MAKLKCLCGNSLSNTDSPSKNIVHIYKKCEVDETITNAPQIRLIDFELFDRPFEYWYCPSCQRIHKVENVPCGNVLASYSITSLDDPAINSCEELESYYVFSDLEVFAAEEEDASLADFILKNGEAHLYLVNQSQDKVYQRLSDGQIKPVYEKTQKADR